jgi:hypothetical protein
MIQGVIISLVASFFIQQRQNKSIALLDALSILVMCLSSALYWSASVRPAVVAKQDQEQLLRLMTQEPDTSGADLRFCTTCMLNKAEGAHHCPTCDACFQSIDHHCPFVNNCKNMPITIHHLCRHNATHQPLHSCAQVWG